MPAREVIYLVDDDGGTREGLTDLLAASGHHVIGFESAGAFLGWMRDDDAACLVLDLHLPDMDGLTLQREVNTGTAPPILFLTGAGDVPTAVRAMQAGALGVFTKPADPAALVDAIEAALREDRTRRLHRARLHQLQAAYRRLTPRERQVMPLIVSGLLNKQAASILGIAEVTLQIHRRQIMRKMAAGSFAELVRMALELGIHPIATAA